MTGYVDEDIIRLLAEHGPMTAVEMRDIIYPDTPRWDYYKRSYIYSRCKHMMRNGKLAKTKDGTSTKWSLAEGTA